jgi:hypothetical protein
MDDSTLATINGSDFFITWFDLLRRRAQMNGCPIEFSGYASLELECSKYVSGIEQSIDTLRRLC